MNVLFYAHSGFRYLVLLTGLVALLYLTYGWVARKPYTGAARGVTIAFVALLHLQVLLGVGLFLTWEFYPALIGHVVMMLLAATIATVASVMSKRAELPRRKWGVAAMGVAVTLLLIIGGITSIGRTIF